MLIYGVIFYGLMALFGLAITWLWGDFSSWHPHTQGVPVLIDIGLGVALGLAIVVVSRVLTMRIEAAKVLAREFAKVLGKLRWWEALALALASGIGEEALFRAALQPLWGLVPASLLFGMLHVGPQRHYLIWTVFAMAFGFLIGGLTLLRPGIWLPASAHITVNACNLWWISQRFAHVSASPWVDKPLPGAVGTEAEAGGLAQ